MAHLPNLATQIVVEMSADQAFYDAKGEAQKVKLAEDQGAYDTTVAESRAGYISGREELHTAHMAELSKQQADFQEELDAILGNDGDEGSLEVNASLHAVIKYINDWDGTTDGLVNSAKDAQESTLQDYIESTGVTSDSAFEDAYAAAQAAAQS